MYLKLDLISLASALLMLPCALSASPVPEGDCVRAAGTIHSVQGVGLCADFGSGEFHSIAFTADLIDILNGRASTPGLKCTYHYNMPFLCRETRSGYTYCIYAGPGIAQGYVRNLDGHPGYMAGISGDIGGRIMLGHNIMLSLEFQGDLALLFKNRNISNMSLYTNGLRHSYYPYLRIQYRF